MSCMLYFISFKLTVTLHLVERQLVNLPWLVELKSTWRKWSESNK